jgi:predicted unusual protein kinase regulating ubiquinone biosynthesis (AarF/ABC1/UbiB family)
MQKEFKILNIFYKQYRAFRKFSRLNESEKKVSHIPERLVNDLLELGTTFIKLGQILSTRPDVLPTEYIVALERLQENVPPFDFKVAKEIMESELEKSIDVVFQSIEEKPIASASLSQVHFALLHSGEQVALKVQRPNVKSKVLADLQALDGILAFVNFFFPKKVRRTNLINGFREFKRYTIQELDFAHEGETIERFRENFSNWDDIIFPTVYWDYSSEKLLTMERISGLRLKEAVNKLSTESKEKLYVRLAEMELKMFISDGLFHADLHPGNIFFKEDGKIALLDFGMYGELSKEERNRFVLYWLAVVQNDVKRAFYYFKKQCKELPKANEMAFYEVFKILADSFYKSSLKEVSITKVYLSMISAGYSYGYVFPENLLLHAKALTSAEALTFGLAPDARFEEITKPIITKEFANIVINSKQINERMNKVLPEFLLTGEIIPSILAGVDVKTSDTSILGNAVYNQLIQNILNWEKNAGAFKAIINPYANIILKEKLGEHLATELLEESWEEYSRLEGNLPKQQSLGATFTLHLACATIAIYNTMIKSGKSKEEATELIYQIGWKIYTRLGEIPTLIAGIFSDNPTKKMEFATQVFRMFPFSSPDYGWEDIKAEKNTIAFNCTRCHIAEYFKGFELSDVCYNTWCKLDFPLAEQWGGKLERTGSIAGGAELCDFRWKVKPIKSYE